jgi:hypothetical protein
VVARAFDVIDVIDVIDGRAAERLALLRKKLNRREHPRVVNC